MPSLQQQLVRVLNQIRWSSHFFQQVHTKNSLWYRQNFDR